MRSLNGTKPTDAPGGWREALDGQRIVVDLGAGDGRWVYESARSDLTSVYIAVDPDAEALAQYAFKASRKPARGGVANAHFVIASVEQLPPELEFIADLARVNFPWGSLLRGLIEPQAAALDGLAALLKPGAAFEIIVAYVPDFDPKAFAGQPLAELDEAGVEALKPTYAAHGLQIESSQQLTQDEALAIASTWGRRLLHARPRPVLMVSGIRI